jgi:hypothetical protein
MIGGLDTSRHDQAANPSSNLKTKPSNHSVGQISATSTGGQHQQYLTKKNGKLGGAAQETEGRDSGLTNLGDDFFVFLG